MSPALVVENLGKSFDAHHEGRPNTIMSAALSGFRRMRVLERRWALRDINFELQPGEAIGVLGHNGAGKSTLLNLLGRVIRPDEGRIATHGQLGTLLDLGTGFHDDLTGLENLEIAALIAGMNQQQIRASQQKIVEFAELEHAVSKPLRMFSTGMRMRLAFSLAVHNQPDLLLIDEHLAVGDMKFRAKCMARVMELKNNGCALVLVTQDPVQVTEHCDRALLLEHGRLVACDDSATVARTYQNMMSGIGAKNQAVMPPVDSHSPVKIGRLAMSENEILAGNSLTISIELSAESDIAYPVLSLQIVNAAGVPVIDVSSRLEVGPDLLSQGITRSSLLLERLDLTRGQYSLRLAVFSADGASRFAHTESSQKLKVRAPAGGSGIVNPPCTWALGR